MHVCNFQGLAMQNMTESYKKMKLTIFKHSKKFSFGLKKYNNTSTMFK